MKTSRPTGFLDLPESHKRHLLHLSFLVSKCEAMIRLLNPSFNEKDKTEIRRQIGEEIQSLAPWEEASLLIEMNDAAKELGQTPSNVVDVEVLSRVL